MYPHLKMPRNYEGHFFMSEIDALVSQEQSTLSYSNYE
jgi:hypothetical protein